MYVFWKLTSDPPAPWARLTRNQRYVRLASDTALHGTTTGAATHNNHTIADWVCGNCASIGGDRWEDAPDDDWSAQAVHSNHSAPSSPSISSNSNNPPAYGLDIIYMDLGLWETTERRFPQGAVVLSNGALVESSELARFSSADGKLITIDSPGTTSGSSEAQSHTVSGSTGNGGASGTFSAESSYSDPYTHHHTFELNSSSKSLEPRVLVTRLYEALLQTPNALADTVVFVDGPAGANFEVLTGWANANLKAGNQDPALSGSDTHDHTTSGNTGSWSHVAMTAVDGGSRQLAPAVHFHPISFTLSEVSHVPESMYLIPARLISTMVLPRGRRAHGLITF